jgi:hypothetical protein
MARASADSHVRRRNASPACNSCDRANRFYVAFLAIRNVQRLLNRHDVVDAAAILIPQSSGSTARDE